MPDLYFSTEGKEILKGDDGCIQFKLQAIIQLHIKPSVETPTELSLKMRYFMGEDDDVSWEQLNHPHCLLHGTEGIYMTRPKEDIDGRYFIQGCRKTKSSFLLMGGRDVFPISLVFIRNGNPVNLVHCLRIKVSTALTFKIVEFRCRFA
jgi:hypothetical protein